MSTEIDLAEVVQDHDITTDSQGNVNVDITISPKQSTASFSGKTNSSLHMHQAIASNSPPPQAYGGGLIEAPKGEHADDDDLIIEDMETPFQPPVLQEVQKFSSGSERTMGNLVAGRRMSNQKPKLMGPSIFDKPTAAANQMGETIEEDGGVGQTDGNETKADEPDDETGKHARMRSETVNTVLNERREEEKRRNCRDTCSDTLMSLPRFRLLCSFLHTFLCKLLMVADVVMALRIGNYIWEQHEFIFAGGFALIVSPIIIAWTACLIYIEQVLVEQVFGDNWKNYALYPLVCIYLITPLGVLMIIFCEVFYFVEEVFESLVRFLFGWMPENVILRSTGRTSFNRFRRITHMLAQSIPQLVFYGYIYKFDRDEITSSDTVPMEHSVNNLELYVAASVSLANVVYTLFSFKREASSLKISFAEYCALSMRLFGGFIPHLKGIKCGETRYVNWGFYAFGSYSYAKFAAAVESNYCRLKRIVITSNTLRSLSKFLCFYLGAACKGQRIKVEVWCPYEPWTIWKRLQLEKNKITLSEFKTALRNLDFIAHRSKTLFDKVFDDLAVVYQNNMQHLYYYSAFKRDYEAGFFAPLFKVIAPDLIRRETLSDRDDKLLNLFLGAGLVNEIDQTTNTSALFHAIEKLDHDLIDKLCDKGARTSNSDWKNFGEMLLALTVDGDYEKLSSIINLARRRSEIELDLDYRDVQTGKSVLHFAAEMGKREIVELFLNSEMGADVLGVDNEGLTAADLAKKNGHEQVEEYLRDQF